MSVRQFLTFVCFKWKPPPGYRSHFGPETVNTLMRMLERHYNAPHELVCVTDDPAGIDKRVRIVPLWDDHAKIRSPHGGNNPACYRRLKMFSREAATIIAPQFVVMDLDCVITGDLIPLFDLSVDFRIWGDTARGTPYNGSLWQLKAGARRQVWERFDPIRSPMLGRKLGYIGSDQAWIGACLGPNESKWTAADGVYSFRNELQSRKRKDLPDNAKVCIFHGKYDPWSNSVQREFPWVREHYK